MPDAYATGWYVWSHTQGVDDACGLSGPYPDEATAVARRDLLLATYDDLDIVEAQFHEADGA